MQKCNQNYSDTMQKRAILMKIIENMRFLKVGTELAVIYSKETLLKKYFIIRSVKDDN